MNDVILQEISDFCRQVGLAESTFGRRAVNDGKLASRLRNGGRITTETLDRIRGFMASHRDKPALSRPLVIERTAALRAPMRSEGPVPIAHAARPSDPLRNFRFFDNRQKYLLFVNTCSEKWVVASRVALELGNIHPRPPAVRLFDAGVGDGSVLVRVDALDARPLPAHAVLRGRQGDQPRGHPPHAAEDGGPLPRASADRAGADQPRLCGCAVARGEVAERRLQHGVA